MIIFVGYLDMGDSVVLVDLLIFVVKFYVFEDSISKIKFILW